MNAGFLFTLLVIEDMRRNDPETIAARNEIKRLRALVREVEEMTTERTCAAGGGEGE